MRKPRWIVLLSASLITAAPAAAQDADALFKTYCATCHEGPRADAQAPNLETLRRLSAEQVLAALERGSMRARASERSRAQRRALAEYVSGKRLAESTGSMPKSAFCAAAPGGSEPPPLASRASATLAEAEGDGARTPPTS